MAKRRKKMKWNDRRMVPYWVLSAIVALILFAFLTGNRSLFKLYALREEVIQLREQRDSLEKQNLQLREEIEKLQRDLEFIEQRARDKYNLKRKNEEVFKVVPE